MKLIKIPLQTLLYALLCAMPLMFAGTTAALSIQINPALPKPAETVEATVALNACARFERWERLSNRIVVYSSRQLISPCPAGGSTSLQLGALNAGNYSIEIFERDTDTLQPPDGYGKRGERRFTVGLGRSGTGSPASVSTLGTITSVSSFVGVSDLSFSVRDLDGVAVPDAPIGISAITSTGNPYALVCGVFEFGPQCPAFQTRADGQFSVSLPAPRDSEGSALLTFVVSTSNSQQSVASAYKTLGYIDTARRESVTPIVEYEITLPSLLPSARYFLTASETEMRLLDSASQTFRRTFAAFFGVKADTPGAVPICRFFASGRSGAPFTHVFSADAAECARLAADSRYTAEGNSFWAFPSSPSGACPRDTRGVTRYALLREGETQPYGFRYSMLASLREKAAKPGPDPSGLVTRTEGVAFCVPA